MGRFLRLDDRDLDRLLAGHAPADQSDLDELAGFFRDVIHTFQAAPQPSTEARHLTAIREAVLLLPAAGPPSSAAGHERLPSARQKRRLRGRSWIARPVLTAILALGLFCGVAYAGVLPGPVQGAVAAVARNVGVSLPGAHNNKNDGAQNDKNNGEQNNVPARIQTDTNTGVQSNDGGVQSNGNDGARNEGSHGSQNGNSEGSQHGSSGAQNNTNGHTNGTSGNDGSSTFNQDPPGTVGATPLVGPDDGNQGNGNG